MPPLNIKPDQSDTLAARRDDVEALSVLYRDHAPALLRTLTALLTDRSEAEDTVHDLFVGLPDALKRYQDRGPIAPWLHRVAVRLGLSRLRTRKRRGEVSLQHAEAHVTRTATEGLADRMLVETALANLPESLRVVVVLRELEGWPYLDIAEHLGLREGAVMTRHWRGMKRLRLALQEAR